MFMSSIRRWRSGLIVVAGMNAVIGRLLSLERSRNALPTPTAAQSMRCGLALICTASHQHPSRAAGSFYDPLRPKSGRAAGRPGRLSKTLRAEARERTLVRPLTGTAPCNRHRRWRLLSLSLVGHRLALGLRQKPGHDQPDGVA